MHEATLIADLIRKIENIADAREATKIVGVKVKIGALAHISPEHLREHFLHAAVGTCSEGAQLEIETLTDITDPHAQEIILESIEIE